MKKIVFIHLLNDFSGSPKVLSQVMDVAKLSGIETHLYTCSGEVGFLDRVEAKRFSFPYKHFSNRFLTLFSYLSSQLVLFLKLLSYRKEPDTVLYINTMLPFGAGLAGKVMGKKVIFHIHETSIKPRILKFFLRWIIKLTASEVIFVSEYLRQTEAFDGVESTVVYNGIAVRKSISEQKKQEGFFNVLMICSLRTYKGVNEFVSLAKEISKINPSIRFTLILGASETEVNLFFHDEVLPTNLLMLPKQSDVTKYYLESDLLVSFSRPDLWVETFGLTIVEGMSYGLPVIVPPIGGPSEIIKNGEHGYLIDSRDLDELIFRVCYLMEHQSEYNRLSINAFNRAKEFSLELFSQKIKGLLV
ncbi:MAG: glycosyltransferase family 4 protein [Legionella sp.]|nr:glycosyltransferase family 4 protein [Legionella sp.]